MKEAAEKHNVTNDIMISPILRRMANMYNEKHDAEKRRESKNMKDAIRSSLKARLLELPRLAENLRKTMQRHYLQ